MPKYKISGKNIDSGRKRTITHQAIDEMTAKAYAEREGIEILEIIQLPEESPTERQIEFAQSLGIKIPHNVTKYELSDLISISVDKDKPSEIRHIKFAKIYGVECTQYIGKKSLFDKIQSELIKPGNELNMLSWFSFRVYRELVSGQVNPELDDPSDPIFTSVAQELITDEKIIKSIRRYAGRDLIWFGEWKSPSGYLMSGGSVQTIAYKTISTILREKLSLSIRTKINNEELSTQGSNNDSKGCLFTIFAVLILPALAFLLYVAK